MAFHGAILRPLHPPAPPRCRRKKRLNLGKTPGARPPGTGISGAVSPGAGGEERRMASGRGAPAALPGDGAGRTGGPRACGVTGLNTCCLPGAEPHFLPGPGRRPEPGWRRRPYLLPERGLRARPAPRPPAAAGGSAAENPISRVPPHPHPPPGATSP